MYFYQSNFFNNVFIFALGIILIIIPTALTTTSMNNTNSFYPDLFLCFIFSSALNRPKTINLYLILFLLLFSDILHMKPIGLLTIIVLISVIIIHHYQVQIENTSFYIHYFIFFICISYVQILNLFLHHMLFIPKPSLLVILKQAIFTVICYPLFDIPYKLLSVQKR